MKKKKDIVINIEPFDLNIHTYSEGFTLTFRAPTKKRSGEVDFSRRKIVKVRFEYWWLKVIVAELWKAIVFKREELEELEEGMKEQ